MRYTIYIIILFLIVGGVEASAQQKKAIKKSVMKGYIPTEAGNLVSDESEVVKFFDEKGNLLEERRKRISPYTNVLTSRKVTNYYGDDLLIDSTLIYNDDKFSMKLGYANDSLGRIAEIRELAPDGGVNFRTKLFYDERGNKVKEKMYDKEDALYNFKDFIFDKNNNLIEELGTEKGEKRFHWISKYNKKNLAVERIDKSGQDVVLRKRKYEYDSNNMLVTEKVFTPEGQLQQVLKYEYEFY